MGVKMQNIIENIIEYSHITQSVLISSLTSAYFAWKWFHKQSDRKRKHDDDQELMRNILIIRNDQNSKIADLCSAIVQVKINIDILMTDFHSCQLDSSREIKEIRDQLDSLSVLINAIGDSSELTQNSTDTKLRLVEKETNGRLKHLQTNVERLKDILLTSDLVSINQTVTETEELTTKVAELNAIKKGLEKKLACGDIQNESSDMIKCSTSSSDSIIAKNINLRGRIAKLRDSVKTDKRKISDITDINS